MRRAILEVLLPVCYLGIGASLVVHLLALVAGRTVPNSVVLLLHVGIFVVAIPTILILRRITDATRPKDLWSLLKSASPPWLRRLSSGTGVYFVVIFVVFAVAHRGPEPTGAPMSRETLVMFSSGWLGFYTGLAAYIHAGLQADSMRLRCPSGHAVNPSSRYCEECGSPVARSGRDDGA